MAAATGFLDDAVKEYLLFRGFTNTLKAFEADLRLDKDKGLKIDKIVQQLLSYISSNDLQSTKDFWTYLNRRFFTRLSESFASAVKTLENCLYKLYLVQCLQNNRQERVVDFFDRMAVELQSQSEWKDWFALPYLKSADQHPSFEMYFSKAWTDTFTLSLYNFLSVVFNHMPLPTLLSYEDERQKIKELEDTNRQLRNEIRALTAAASTHAATQRVRGRMMPSSKLGRGDQVDGESKSGNGKDRKALLKADTVDFIDDYVVLPKGDVAVTQQGTPKQYSMASVAQSPAKQAAPVVKLQQMETTTNWKSAKPTKEASSNTGTTVGTAVGLTVDLPIEMMSLKRTATTTPVVAETNEDQAFLVLGQEVYQEHSAAISHCCFSTTGSLVASADTEGLVKVWSFAPIQTRATLQSKSQLLCLGWANRVDRLLLLGTSTGKLRLYDTEAKRTYCDVEADAEYPRVLSVSSSPNGQLLVYSCAADISRDIISLPTAKCYGDPLPEMHSPRRKRRPECTGALVCWDVKAMKTEQNLPLDPAPTAINCSAFNHNGNLLVTGAADGMIRLFDMTQCDVLMGWQAHIGEVFSVQFSSDETTVYSIGEDGKFTQWSLHHIGQRIADLQIPLEACNPLFGTATDANSRMSELAAVPRGNFFAFDADGQYVLTCGSTHGLVYKLENGMLSTTMTLGGHQAAVVSVDWSTAMHCGTCLTGSLDGTVRVTTILKQ